MLFLKSSEKTKIYRSPTFTFIRSTEKPPKMKGSSYEAKQECFNETVPVLLMIGEKHAILVNIFANFLLALTSSTGNASILLSFLFVPSLRTTSNYLLFGLALTDLFVGLVVHPSYITVMFNLYNDTYPQCSVTLFFCISVSFLGCLSMLTITLIGVDRYLAIRLNLRYQEYVTDRRVIIALIVLWLISCLFCLIWLAGFSVYTSSMIVLLGLSLLVLCAVYAKLYSVVRHHKIQIQCQSLAPQINGFERFRQRKLLKSTMTTLYVFFTFLVCYLPFSVAMAVNNIRALKQKQTIIAFEFTMTVMLFNSSLNPLMYCFRLREFRVAVKKTYRSIFCLQRTRSAVGIRSIVPSTI